MPLPNHRGPRHLAWICRAGAALAVGVLVVGGGSAGAAAAPGSAGGVSVLVGTGPVTSPGALPLHARLTASSPADGSTVRTVPEIVLTFSEEVNPSFVAVTVEGPEGDETDAGPAVDGREVRQALVSGLAAGAHVATFRVVSADGHPISGTVTFTTTQGPTPTQASPGGGGTAAPPSSSGPPSSPASSAGSATTSWAVPGLGAVLVAAAIGWALWRSRSRPSDSEGPEEPRGP